MPWNPFSRKKKVDENDQGGEGYAGDYHYDISPTNEDGTERTQEELDAIWRIINDPDFDGWDETMGTVPHTPYRQERPDDPDTGKIVSQPKPRK